MNEQYTPMTIKAARILCERMSKACGVDRDDNWNLYAEDFKADAKAMLDACGAHDLLEALCGAISDVEYIGADGWMTGQMHSAEYKSAVAAIAKATGKTT